PLSCSLPVDCKGDPCARHGRTRGEPVHRTLTLLVACCLFAAGPAAVLAKSAEKSRHASASRPKDCVKPTPAAAPKPRHKGQKDKDCATIPSAPAFAELTGELGVVQKAIRLVRARKITEATELARSIDDPVARKLVEWVRLRDAESGASFGRYDA